MLWNVNGLSFVVNLLLVNQNHKENNYSSDMHYSMVVYWAVNVWMSVELIVLFCLTVIVAKLKIFWQGK